MDSRDDRVLMPVTPHDAVNAMMSDMQGSQGFLGNFDDAATILTYFINDDNESCAGIVPSMDQTHQPSVTGSHDHPYSRIRTETTTTSSSSVVNTVGSFVNNSDTIHQMNLHMNNSPLSDSPNLMSHLTSHDNYLSSTSYASTLLSCNVNNDDTVTNEPSSVYNSSAGHNSDDRSPLIDSLSSGSVQIPSKESNPEKIVPLHVNSMTKTVENPRANLGNKSVKFNPNRSSGLEHLLKTQIYPTVNQCTNIQTNRNPSSSISESIQSQAELRTVVTFKVIYKGQVVKENLVKDEEIIIKQGETIPWSEAHVSQNIGVLSSVSRTCSHSVSQPLPDSFDVVSSETEKCANTFSSQNTDVTFNNCHSNSSTTSNKTSINSSRKRTSSNSDSEFFKDNQILSAALSGTKKRSTCDNSSLKKSKVKDDKDLDSEEARRETATALLSLQGNQALRGNNKTNVTIDADTDQEFKPICKDARVMAKWTDRNFYPGIISEMKGDGRWEIRFDDGGKRVIPESEIICVPYLSVGQRVMVTFSEGFCAKGIVKSHEIKGSDVEYIVEYEDQEKKVVAKFPGRDVFLTAELASLLIGSQFKSSQSVFAGLDLNNIIPKTARKVPVVKQSSGSDSTSDSQNTETTSPVVTRNVQSKKEKRPVPLESSDHNASKSGRPTKQAPVVSVSLRPTIPNNSLRSVNSIAKTLPPAEVEKCLGPLPREGSQLFKGIGFLFATAEGVENIALEAGRSTMFDCPYLIKQIELGAGKYFESFEEKQAAKDVKETVLIAYTYLRTVEYMRCLASGLPCLMHTWIVQCCRQNQLVKREDHLLPSGNVFKKIPTVFKGTKILFAGNKSKLFDNWSPVLIACGATIAASLPTSIGTATRKTSNSVDFIVGDSSCPNSVVMKANQLRIPIMSTEYIVECLILGKKLPFDAHEKFRYDFKTL
ncbi:hypothetical protein B4U80_03616 [Leptotrombidium deliense]|uniref:BRCT domain-containing protein n=1 Tax=Leptotrombidium deliense TaxID=299467 RepID=A0A443SRY4_9ACAR|nr:hypothetical protein B4U80_03616 [Leptotrombidium deliense]